LDQSAKFQYKLFKQCLLQASNQVILAGPEPELGTAQPQLVYKLLCLPLVLILHSLSLGLDIFTMAKVIEKT
jgi:hypothetical protein